jgi:hypothetical protein
MSPRRRVLQAPAAAGGGGQENGKAPIPRLARPMASPRKSPRGGERAVIGAMGSEGTQGCCRRRGFFHTSPLLLAPRRAIQARAATEAAI